MQFWAVKKTVLFTDFVHYLHFPSKKPVYLGPPGLFKDGTKDTDFSYEDKDPQQRYNDKSKLRMLKYQTLSLYISMYEKIFAKLVAVGGIQNAKETDDLYIINSFTDYTLHKKINNYLKIQ